MAKKQGTKGMFRKLLANARLAFLSDYEHALGTIQDQQAIIRYQSRKVGRQNGSWLELHTNTRNQLYQMLEQEFFHLKAQKLAGQDTEETKVRLKAHLDDYVSMKFVPGSEFWHSLGSQGGTVEIKHSSLRIKRLTESQAAKSAFLNDFISAHYPDRTVFAEAIGPYFMAENFEGRKLGIRVKDGDSDCEEFASKEIMLRQLSFVNGISRLNPGIPSYKLDYPRKLMESVIALSFAYDISPDTICAFSSMKSFYFENSTVPLWDAGYLPNTKYNDKGKMKSFDFLKADTLVLPTTDAVKLSYGYGMMIPEMKMQSRDQLSIQGFEEMWEHDALYFLTRQLMYADKHNDGFLRKKYLGLILSEDFSADAGRLLQKDIMNSAGRFGEDPEKG